MRRSPHRKLSRDFSLSSSSSGDLEVAQPTIPACTSCGRPFPVDDVFLDCSIPTSITSGHELEARPVVGDLREPEQDVFNCSIQSSITSERELEARPVVCDLTEPVEDDQDKEMTFKFPGAYPIEQVVSALDEPASLPPRHSVEGSQKKISKTEVYPGFKELFLRLCAYVFDW